MKFGILRDIKNGVAGACVRDEKLDPALKPTLTRSDNYYPEFDI